MIFKAVIFDLDGTLLNTIDDIADAVNQALSDLGCPTHDVEIYRIIVGAGVENLVWRILPEGRRDEQTQKRCLEGVREYYKKFGLRKTRPYDGIKDLLDKLANRGVKLAVLSNKPHENTVIQVAHYLGDHVFDEVHGAKPNVPNKPDPTSALGIAKRFKVDPAECIFVGDSDIDMQTAKNAGMYPVGVLWGFRSHEELLAHGAKRLIENPLQLTDLFGIFKN
jgi:phosphoglycolate phosphatase